jgi:hypothetical protein
MENLAMKLFYKLSSRSSVSLKGSGVIFVLAAIFSISIFADESTQPKAGPTISFPNLEQVLTMDMEQSSGSTKIAQTTLFIHNDDEILAAADAQATKPEAPAKPEAKQFLPQKPAILNFSAVLRDNDGNVQEITDVSPKNIEIEPQDTKAVKIQLPIASGSPPFVGYLEFTATRKGMTGENIKTQVRQIRINPPRPSSTLILVPLALAAIVCAISFLIIKRKVKKVKLKDRMGSVTWSYNSWASNITIAGASLTTILTFAALPERTHHFSKTGYATLAFLFGVLVGLAPIIYNFVRVPVRKTDSDSKDEPHYQGFVGMFLVVCIFTIWGVAGQLSILGFSLDEIAIAGLTDKSIIDIFKALLWSVIGLMLIYASFSIYWTVKKQRDVEDVAIKKAKANSNAALSESTIQETASQSLPKWSLL